MSRKNVENRHSETALFAALCRAVAARVYGCQKYSSDSLAANFLPAHIRFFIRFESIRQRFIKKNVEMTPGAFEYVLARTTFFDHLFEDSTKNAVSQIVLLGAGYDSRSYRFPEVVRTSKIFELDITTTQERKIKCIKKSGIDVPSNVTMLPINFNKDDIVTVLKDGGFDPEEKTLFLWEGVTMYLDPEAVATTFASLARNVRAGSLIAFDYVLNIPEADMGDYYGVAKFMETWKKHRKEEPFRFTSSEEDMVPLLTEHGLSLACHLNDKEIHDTYLSENMGRITAQFRFTVASIGANNN
ncbi:MAG TPA: SAM-dependent methyltransferase [Pseudomonadales bacterium]|jgi:methyltransferase (TIGR00027 family)|nr:SAM-dependent methyltransferase [Pseudomonadales bacterium]MDP6316811.1 SAM-dependent methyltransferase [Pseudomonadales bacterium]MDP7314575.1 SAM-dependent methyltransferase [Pseudomonadales bacterium]MDP7575401.1 SAM-dependent methyltransferase [Pseudomonadales bacterium]HJL61939.1 SAM-dependent methyltransferase [Pseudomonadales bacterium]